MVAESGLKIEGLDYKWACKYVALAMKPEEVRKRGLQDIIPRKIAKKGKDPTLRTVNEDDKKERFRSQKVPNIYTEEEKKKLLQVMVEVMITLLGMLDVWFYKE